MDEYEYIKQIINEPVNKLKTDKFNEFKGWLKRNKIDEKSNFVKGLIEFVKNELEKTELNKNELEKNNEEHNVIVTVNEGDLFLLS